MHGLDGLHPVGATFFPDRRSRTVARQSTNSVGIPPRTATHPRIAERLIGTDLGCSECAEITIPPEAGKCQVSLR